MDEDDGNNDVNNEACNFIKKETLTHVFSSELCELFKNTFFTESLSATASGVGNSYILGSM